ncbi:uncharacterized protein [Phyllobates terribilis]|uniref:uncharacterized protein n=1 Tax=Phyllobates terribilis TaxID=111132 RepID=UPI003CCAD8CB
MLGQWERLCLRDGLLYLRVQLLREFGTTRQVVIPEKLIGVVAKEAHERGAHFGPEKTFQWLQRLVYHPRLRATLEDTCRRCRSCELVKPPEQGVPIQTIETSAPLEVLIIDHLTVGLAHLGYEHCLVMTDHFTKFVVVTPTIDQTAKSAAQAICRDFIRVYGCPKRIHSDQGACFQGRVMEELHRLYQIEKSRTPHRVKRRMGAEGPVYEVQPEGAEGAPTIVVHRSMLRPCLSKDDEDGEESPASREGPVTVAPSHDVDEEELLILPPSPSTRLPAVPSAGGEGTTSVEATGQAEIGNTSDPAAPIGQTELRWSERTTAGVPPHRYEQDQFIWYRIIQKVQECERLMKELSTVEWRVKGEWECKGEDRGVSAFRARDPELPGPCLWLQGEDRLLARESGDWEAGGVSRVRAGRSGDRETGDVGRERNRQGCLRGKAELGPAQQSSVRGSRLLAPGLGARAECSGPEESSRLEKRRRVGGAGHMRCRVMD